MTNLSDFLDYNPLQTILVKPDLIVIGDNISLDFAKKLSEMTPKYPDKLVVMNCYDVPSGDFISSEIQKRLIRFSKKYNTSFEQADGVMYYTVLDKYAKENMIIVSSGRHNSVFGVKNCLGINLTEEQLRTVIETGKIEIVRPDDFGLRLNGNLPEDVMAKDLSIRLSTELKNKLNGKLIYLSGDGLDNLSKLQQRDVFQCLDSLPIFSVIKKEITTSYDVQLSETVSMVSLPESMSNGIPLKEIDKQPINSCLIGGATGSSIEDLRIAAHMLEGKKVPITMRLTVSPETNDVYDQAMKEGLITIFIDANVQIIASGYGSIARPSKAVVGDGETQVVTNYWNYVGYNGSKQSKTLIASTKTAVECALSQKIGTKLSVVEGV